MTTPDPSRTAFEQWYSTAGENSRSVERQEDGRYIYVPTEVCWVAWQAAMAHKGPDCWQSIETAPKDGSVFLALSTFPVNGQPWHYECMWNGFEWYHGFGDAWPDAKPTHWQPLPAAPKQEGST